MQSKITVSFHFTTIRMVIMKNPENNKHQWGCGEIGSLAYCCWEHKMLQPLWKTIWQLLKKLKIGLPYNPAIPLLGIYPKEMKSVPQRDCCAPMFIAALFIIAKI